MKLVLGQDEAVAGWVARRLGYGEDFFGPCRSIAVVGSNDEPLAGIVYSGYRPHFRSIELSIVADSPRFATRSVIHAILAFPFLQWQCERISITCALKNKRAVRFAQGLGFVKEGIARKGFGDDHAVVLSMLRKEFDRLFARRCAASARAA